MDQGRRRNALAVLCLWSGNELDDLTDDCSAPSPPRSHTPRPDASPPSQQAGFSLTRPATSCGSATHPPQNDRPQPPSPSPTSLPNRHPPGCPPLPGVVATTLRPRPCCSEPTADRLRRVLAATTRPTPARAARARHIEQFGVEPPPAWRGWLAATAVAASVSKRTVIDLRAFFGTWRVGWAERPAAARLPASRLDRPLPSAPPMSTATSWRLCWARRPSPSRPGGPARHRDAVGDCSTRARLPSGTR